MMARSKELEEYFALEELVDEFIGEGMNALNPIIRSILSRQEKLYRRMSDSEKNAALFEDNIYFA